jgi:hypothetical protein
MFPDNSPSGAAYVVTNDKGDKVPFQFPDLCSPSFLIHSQVFIPHPVHDFRVWDSAAGLSCAL